MTLRCQTRRQAIAAVSAVLALGIAATAHAASPANPAARWQKVAPASVGLDPAGLDRIADRARRGKSNCLVVVRDGKLAGEWYFRGTRPDTTQDVFSATKSVAGTLIGMAQDDGDLRIADSAARWIPQWRGTPSQAVTVRDLLSMDSGRQWSPFTDYVRLLTARDQTEFAVGLGQEAAPGTVWAYNNSAVQTLDRVLGNATGTRVVDFARRRLFAPLGMVHTSLSTDASGNAQMFEGMRSTCRDLARFGVLMLDNGIWSGRQIVSAAWVKAATGVSSTALNAGYGYLWWLNHKGVVASVLSATRLRGGRHAALGRLVPGAPARMYWALGLGNQLIQVDPGTRTVVVRLGTPDPLGLPPTFGPAAASKVVTEAVVGGAR